jgi:hypothetical protein
MHGAHKPINSLYLRDKKCFAAALPDQENSRATGSREWSAGNQAEAEKGEASSARIELSRKRRVEEREELS